MTVTGRDETGNAVCPSEFIACLTLHLKKYVKNWFEKLHNSATISLKVELSQC